jgi:hypothetical protein
MTERSIQKTLRSYFFWTHPRGSFHYDVMVTLILAFIFLTPRFINWGDKAPLNSALAQPIQVERDGNYGLIITVPTKSVAVDLSADNRAVRRALHEAIQPVTGDAVFVVRWETVAGPDGKPVAWKVWAHR